MLRVAHLSDLHLTKMGFHFFSKRLLGTLNLLAFRKRKLGEEQLKLLPPLLQKLNVDLVIATGDLTSMAKKEEFVKAKELLKDLNLIALPGNHDLYTKKAEREKRFYSYFTNKKEGSYPGKELSLKNDAIEVHPLQKWVLICLDTAFSTPLFSSAGSFSLDLEKKLLDVLSYYPDKKIALACHFSPKEKNPRKHLIRKSALLSILKKHPQIKLFLHGHGHCHAIEGESPVFLDSGSCAYNHLGSFNLLDFFNDRLVISVFKWKNAWDLEETKTIFFS